jgi:hypothetical protein
MLNVSRVLRHVASVARILYRLWRGSKRCKALHEPTAQGSIAAPFENKEASAEKDVRMDAS